MLDLERGQLDDFVLSREDARETGLQILPRHRAQEADPPEVDSDHGHAGSQEPRQCAQHGSVAPEHDCEVGAHGVVVRLLEKLDSVLVGHRLQSCETGSDLARLPVHDAPQPA